MADIQFDEDQYQRPTQIEQKPFFVRLVLATKIVSTDKQAEYVLLGIVIVLIVVAVALPFIFNNGTTPHNPYKEGQNVLTPPEAGAQ
jgi:hypothetical protein